MDKIKCVCPKCGGRLVAWTEYIGYKYENITKNGKIIKKNTLPKADTEGNNWGFSCRGCGEQWSCTRWGMGHEAFPEDIEAVFNKIVEVNKE